MVEALERRPWWKKMEKGGTFNFWWGPNGEQFDFKKLKKEKRQLVNRLQDHREICTKTRLAINLQEYAKKANLDVNTIIPTTYVLEGGGDKGARQLRDKKDEFDKAANGEGKGTKHLKGDIWIVKPGGRNRGIGIEVMKGFNAVDNFIKKQLTSSQWVVQKYLEDPMLIHKCKFDIRQLILVGHDQKVYMYKNSYVRTCATEYAKDSTDLTVHLTNDAVQKKMDNYGKYEDANKLSYDEFRAILCSHNQNFEKDIYPQIQEATRHVFRAALSKLNVRRTDYCFELMGMDFMLDASFKVWLIEINTSPALFRHGAVLEELFPPLMEELAQKVVDKVFPPPAGEVLPQQLNGFELLKL